MANHEEGSTYIFLFLPQNRDRRKRGKRRQKSAYDALLNCRLREQRQCK